MPPIVLTYQRGHRFEGTRLRYLKEAGKNKHRGRMIWCQCDCKVLAKICLNAIRQGRTQSCGCLHTEGIVIRSTVHGLGINHWLYTRWAGIKARCLNEGAENYSRYGGRGIDICWDWREFPKFLAWVESQGMTAKSDFEVHRNSSDLGYNPDNCVCLPAAEHRSIELARRKLKRDQLPH